MTQRTNFTISEANLRWLQNQAPGERGMSRLVDDILQKARTLGSTEAKLAAHVKTLNAVQTKLEELVSKITNNPVEMGAIVAAMVRSELKEK